MTTMTAEIAAQLREPFAAEHVGKLPRVYCKACRDAQFKVCQQHTKRKCRDCGNNITDAHLHLDYVGHAEITDRLLHADPTWTWEPVAFAPDGLPLRDQMGGLWIRLTVAGVTRLGYGHADGKTGPDAVKEAIGDALRNAAMRFGVALDLWGAKFKDTADESEEPEQPKPDPKPRRSVVVVNARKAIADATEQDALDDIGKRLTNAEQSGWITGDDAVELRRLLVARIDELFPAGEQAAIGENRTAEQPDQPAEQPDLGGAWPPVTKPGQGDPA